MKHNKPPMTADDWIRSSLKELRADLKERTMFGPAGKAVLRSNGERRIFGPDGTAIKVVEIPGPETFGGNQIETDHSLHANVRPKDLRMRMLVE